MQVFQVCSQDGINMEKINCYPKTASLIFLIIFLLSLIVGFLPFVLFENLEVGIIRVIWIITISLCVLFSIFGIFHYRQYLYVKGNKLILKNIFYTIKVLDIDKCYYEVSSLQSYYGRRYFLEKWICIYSINETKKFRFGFSNGRKYKRIQLIYTDSHLKFIDNYIKKKNNL